MNVTPLALRGVLLIEPKYSGDDRGFFIETFSARRYESAGIAGPFVQDNLSYSRRGVVRGLHFQNPHGQGKLVSVLVGEVFDVAVDVRIGSPTFGEWCGTNLSQSNRKQLFIPSGFAHGFIVLSDEALFAYKCTDYYRPEAERVIRWDDPRIGISWPTEALEISVRDRNAPVLGAIDQSLLPRYPG